MTILLVNKFLYPKGGDAVCALGTGELLRARGHRAIFWGMRHPDNGPFEHEDTFMPYVDLNAAQGARGQLLAAANLLYSVEARRRLRGLLRRDRPHLAHLHNFAHQLSPSILHALKAEGVPCVMTMHDYKLVCGSYTLLSRGRVCERCAGGRHYHCALQGCVKGSRVKSLLSTAEMYLHHAGLDIYDSIRTFIAPSLFLKGKLEAMGFCKRIVHVPNFVDVSAFAPASGWEEESVVYVGRLSPEKGVMTLIRAAGRVSSLRVTIIGDGPQRAALEAAAGDAGAANVRFLGYLSGEALHRQIRAAMCVVLPSECYENHPRAVIEAFALGKPVIGARIGGIPEAVRDGRTGLTFSPGDAGDLARALEEAVSDRPRLRQWGEAARAVAEAEYGADRHYDALMAVYRSAL